MYLIDKSNNRINKIEQTTFKKEGFTADFEAQHCQPERMFDWKTELHLNTELPIS